MSFAGHVFDAIKRMEQNRALGKHRKIRFKDKDEFYKYRTKKKFKVIYQTEEEKIASRAKVKQEMKAERKKMWWKILAVGILSIPIIWFFTKGTWLLIKILS